MNKERYIALECGNNEDGPHLTQEEISQGWHFCWEYDGMLVGDGMPEMKACLCDIPALKLLRDRS